MQILILSVSKIYYSLDPKNSACFLTDLDHVLDYEAHFTKSGVVLGNSVECNLYQKMLTAIQYSTLLLR
jgi:hypothetical protein